MVHWRLGDIRGEAIVVVAEGMFREAWNGRTASTGRILRRCE